MIGHGRQDNDGMDRARPLLELTGATVRFGADAVLDGVDFRLFPGEVHSLMGENGAGKSTLIKAVTGALPLDEGVLRLDGESVRFSSPHAAQAAGISTVYQEIDDVPAFEPVTKFNATIDDVARFPDMVRQAFRVATSGTPGPVHLQFRGNEGQLWSGSAATPV